MGLSAPQTPGELVFTGNASVMGVGTPRCGVRSAQRADPVNPIAPITDAIPLLTLSLGIEPGNP